MTTTAPAPARAEAPRTLAEPPPTELGLRETFGLWANLGVSLLLPVAASFVVLAGRPLGVSVLAIAVGAVIGAVLLGLTAAPAARERVPAMVLLRGLLGRRAPSAARRWASARRWCSRGRWTARTAARAPRRSSTCLPTPA